MRLPSEQTRMSTPKKRGGRPFEKGNKASPGRTPGSKNVPNVLTLPQAVSAAERAAAGRTPRQLARLLKARPDAVKEAIAQSRRLREVCRPQFAEHWLRASQVAAEDGDHKPAMAALQSIKVVEPIAQAYDVGAGKASAIAGVKVE